MRCPLCGDARVQILQEMSTSDLMGLHSGALARIVGDLLSDLKVIAYAACDACELRFFHPPRPGSEAFYQACQELESYYPQEKPEFAFARAQIERRHRVLEVGCGRGAFGTGLDVTEYVGLEFSPTAAEQARAMGLHVTNEDVETHSANRPEAYDVVCAFQVLEHVADPASFVRACIRALRIGGQLIVSMPSVDSFAASVSNFALDLPPHHLTRWNDSCLRAVGRLFPLDLRQIWHEPLQPVHRRVFAASKLTKLAYALTGRRVPAVDRAFFGRAVAALAGKASLCVVPFGALLDYARGISVTAVYRRRSN